MEKTIMLVNNDDIKKRIAKGKIYLYRISSVILDKITFEKHLTNINNSFDRIDVLSAKITDETKVGVVTQKLDSVLVASVSKKIDEIAIDFIMGDKAIESIDFSGVTSV